MKTSKKLSSVYEGELTKFDKNIMPNLNEAVNAIREEATTKIDRLVQLNLERLMKEMKQEYKRDFKCIFGNGIWILTDLSDDSTYSLFRHPDETVYDRELTIINELDTIAQESNTCLTDFDTTKS